MMRPAPSLTYGTAKPEDVAGMTGRQIMQALIDGTIPAPPIAQTLSFWLVEVGDGTAVFEAETGVVVSSTPIRRRVPVTDYLRIQARYAHLFRPAERTETIARIQAAADRNIARFGLMPETISAERAVVPPPVTPDSPARQ